MNRQPSWFFFVMRHRMIITCLWDNLTPHFLVQKKISKKSLVVHWCWVAPDFVLHNSLKRGNFHRKNSPINKTIFRALLLNCKQEYLASEHMSLSSPFSPVTVCQFWTISRYSCFYLGSRIHDFYFENSVFVLNSPQQK